MDLFEEEKQHKTSKNYNALIFFQDGKKIPVKAFGKHCLLGGYLTFIDGTFSVRELQDNFNEKQIFITDCVDIEIGKIENKKQCVCVAENFFYDNEDFNNKNENYIENVLKMNNITLICNFQPENISYVANNDSCYEKLNNTKCVLYFPDDISCLNDENIKAINDVFNEMKDNVYQINFFKNYHLFNPYCLKSIDNDYVYRDKLEICNDRKKVAIIDFGIYNYLLKILQKYFDVKILPITATAEHIYYLYEEGKIDGVIFSNSICNTSFLEEEIFNEIKKIVNSNIPTLGIEFGACLIAESLGTTTKIVNHMHYYDNMLIRNDKNRLFRVSSFYNKEIQALSLQLKEKYFDKNNNIIGFTSEDKNIIGYNFSFFTNSFDTMYCLNDFYRIIKKRDKKRKIL